MGETAATNGNNGHQKGRLFRQIWAVTFSTIGIVFFLAMIDAFGDHGVIKGMMLTPQEIVAQDARATEQNFIDQVRAHAPNLVCPDPGMWIKLSEPDKERWHRFWRDAQWGSPHSWCGRPVCAIIHGSEIFQGTENCYVPRKPPDKQK